LLVEEALEEYIGRLERAGGGDADRRAGSRAVHLREER
jgi:hypothetical protein